jgi:hypothetical protein
VIIRKVSPLTHVIHERTLNIDEDAYWAYMDGRDDRFIQDVFPDLSASDREFLLSGITPEEWEEAFGDEDDEEPDDVMN